MMSPSECVTSASAAMGYLVLTQKSASTPLRIFFPAAKKCCGRTFYYYRMSLAAPVFEILWAIMIPVLYDARLLYRPRLRLTSLHDLAIMYFSTHRGSWCRIKWSIFDS